MIGPVGETRRSGGSKAREAIIVPRSYWPRSMAFIASARHLLSQASGPRPSFSKYENIACIVLTACCLWSARITRSSSVIASALAVGGVILSFWRGTIGFSFLMRQRSQPQCVFSNLVLGGTPTREKPTLSKGLALTILPRYSQARAKLNWIPQSAAKAWRAALRHGRSSAQPSRSAAAPECCTAYPGRQERASTSRERAECPLSAASRPRKFDPKPAEAPADAHAAAWPVNAR